MGFGIRGFWIKNVRQSIKHINVYKAQSSKGEECVLKNIARRNTAALRYNHARYDRDGLNAIMMT